MENKNKGIAAIVVLVLLVGGLAWWSKSRVVDPASVRNEAQVGEYSVVTSDARPSTVIVLDSVVMAEGGFVTLQEDAGGLPGFLLGVTDYLPAGTKTGIAVKLARETRNGETIYAVVRKDDGDKKFDPSKDLPVLVNNEPVTMRFRIDVNAPTPYESKL